MTSTAIMLPESAIHDKSKSIETPATNRSNTSPHVHPSLAIFTSGHVKDLLELVITHIEEHIETAQDILSPTEIPLGIHDSHSRQIDVCLARFKAAKIPAVSIREYVLRLHMHCPFSIPKLLAVIHYFTVLDVLYMRIAKVVQKSTVHRLLLTAVVIASKVLDDRLIPQVRWSIVGGINLHQLHGLELAFFFLLNGKCWISEACLINAGRMLHGSMQIDDTVDPLLQTEESGVIWSNVGNRTIDIRVPGAETSE